MDVHDQSVRPLPFTLFVTVHLDPSTKRESQPIPARLGSTLPEPRIHVTVMPQSRPRPSDFARITHLAYPAALL